MTHIPTSSYTHETRAAICDLVAAGDEHIARALYGDRAVDAALTADGWNVDAVRGSNDNERRNTVTIQELAGQVYAAREVRIGDELHDTPGAYGTPEYEVLRDGSPDWMRDLMRAAHEDGNILPDDWRYACAFAACEYISTIEPGFEDEGDGGRDFADAYVDVYTADLTAWLASSNHRPAYVDSARIEYGADDTLSTENMLRWGQYLEALEVFGAVASFLAERVEVTEQCDGLGTLITDEGYLPCPGCDACDEVGTLRHVFGERGE